MQEEAIRLARAAAEQHIPPLVANPYHPCTVAYVRFLDAYWAEKQSRAVDGIHRAIALINMRAVS